MGSQTTIFKTKEDMIREMTVAIMSMSDRDIEETYNDIFSSEVNYYAVGEGYHE